MKHPNALHNNRGKLKLDMNTTSFSCLTLFSNGAIHSQWDRVLFNSSTENIWAFSYA